MNTSEALFVFTTLLTVVVLTLNPFWFINLCVLLVSYFSVFFIIESFANGTSNGKRRTFKTEFLANIIAYLFSRWKSFTQHSQKENVEKRKEHCGDSPNEKTEMQTFVKNITTDYIKIWYTTISDNNQFIDECEAAFQELFEKAFVDQLSKMETMKICSVVLENVKHALLINPGLVNVTCERNYAVLFINEWLDSVQLSTLKHISKRDPIYATIRELIVDGALIPLISLVTNPVWLNEAIVKLLTNHSTKKNEKSDIDKKLIDTHNQFFVTNEHSVDIRPSTPEIQQTKNSLLTRSKSAVFDRNLLMTPNLDSSPVSSASEPDVSSDALNSVPEGDEICDMKLFTNVAIPKTEEVTTSNEQYVVYCIEFSALFKELQSKEKVKSETENISSTLVRRRITVKRRFREFTTLQSRLESNSKLKDLLKGAKEPSKLKRETQNLLDMAFGKFKLDKKMLEYRRKSLEQYMIFLCGRETIAHSTELQQFLGYGSDSRYAYVKSSQSILLPLRLDKVLTKSVKGAIKFIKVAMPDEPQEGAFAPSNRDFVPRKATTRAVHLTYGESFNLEHSLDDIDNEKLFNVVRGDIIEREDCLIGDVRSSLFHPSALGPRLQGDGCEETGHEESKLLNTCRQLREELPIANNLIDILTFVLFRQTISNSHLSVMFKLLFGPVFERFTHKLLREHATKENVIHLIHCLHESIWDDEDTSDNQIEYSPQLVVDTVYLSVSRKLPLESKLSPIYKRVIKNFVDCYQVQEKNKIFVYSVLRQLFLNVYN